MNTWGKFVSEYTLAKLMEHEEASSVPENPVAKAVGKFSEAAEKLKLLLVPKGA